ncbi:MAG: amino acid-binding protein [Bacillota bacterium]|nr:amino acid-binding protein [Bacillota bacterium]
MSVKQISVFIENKQGRLIAVTNCLAARDVNILALSAADTADFGILRLIVDHPKRALAALKEDNFTALETEVIAALSEDRPGGLNVLLEALENAGVNVDYIYAFFGSGKTKPLNIIKVDKMEVAVAALAKAGIKMMDGEEVYNM